MKFGNQVGQVTVNGDSANAISVPALPNGGWVNLTDIITTNQSGTFSSVEATRLGGGGDLAYLAIVEVNGEKLIDPSAVDTVTDTPMCNFAVLGDAVNGNLGGALNTNNGTTSVLPVEGKIYAECTINTPNDQHKFGLKTTVNLTYKCIMVTTTQVEMS